MVIGFLGHSDSKESDTDPTNAILSKFQLHTHTHTYTHTHTHTHTLPSITFIHIQLFIECLPCLGTVLYAACTVKDNKKDFYYHRAYLLEEETVSK